MNSTNIPEDIKEHMLTQWTFNKDTIADTYNTLSEDYEKVILTIGYHDPMKCAELVEEIINAGKD